MRDTVGRPKGKLRRPLFYGIVFVVAVGAALVIRNYLITPGTLEVDSDEVSIAYQPREPLDTSGFSALSSLVAPWKPGASLAEIGERFRGVGYRNIEHLDRQLAEPGFSGRDRVLALVMKSTFLNLEGAPQQAYATLEQARALAESEPTDAAAALYTIVYLQGITALRIGENDNCILCRGESSCIIPIDPAAIHTVPAGSRLAIKHFTEYLNQFPDDLEVRWLMNVAHMTLGEHPHKVDPRHLVSLEPFQKEEANLGRFRDIGHLVGVNRLNRAGGGIMDDFDNDGLLDIVTTTVDPAGVMAFFRNTGRGNFENRTEAAGLIDQLGGLNCVQTDYNNDGHLDVFIIRGAWLTSHLAMRPSLLRNNGNGTFSDVTEEAGLSSPVNSIAAAWADYDNDGWLDLFVCCEQQHNRLYRNLQNGRFEEVAAAAGVAGRRRALCNGVAWIDYDNDGHADLFLNQLSEEGGQLYRNNRDGTFTNSSRPLGIEGPVAGFSCWAWDYNNDGWLDIFATCYDRSLEDVVKGLLGQLHNRQSNRLYRNREGKGFENVTNDAGLDRVLATMGSNFGDFDNDGFLDMYLGTGEPSLATLVPNRMFKNIDGGRFAEVTASSHTGNLQKGHGVACGDWDRDGNVDIFIEMGGVVAGDMYHNILLQNPGHDNHWLSVKLVGQMSNRAAVGARIKVVAKAVAETSPPSQGGAAGGSNARNEFVVHRHISSGSSFGANPFEQTIGVGKADRIELLEVHWPTSGTTQVFRDLAVDQAIEVTEFSEDYRKLDRPRIDWEAASKP